MVTAAEPGTVPTAMLACVFYRSVAMFCTTVLPKYTGRVARCSGVHVSVGHVHGCSCLPRTGIFPSLVGVGADAAPPAP